jgi:hypothetical protein
MDFDKYINRAPWDNTEKKIFGVPLSFDLERTRLYELFLNDMIEELGIKDHEKRHLLLGLADFYCPEPTLESKFETAKDLVRLIKD